MKNNGLCRYDNSVDYDSMDVDDILDIHQYLMTNHEIKNV